MQSLLSVMVVVGAMATADVPGVTVDRGEVNVVVSGVLKSGRQLQIHLPADASDETVAANTQEVRKYLDQDAAGTFVYPPEPVPIPQPVAFAQPQFQQPTFNDALDEVNAKRAQRGLRPFARDPGLTFGAARAAQERAARRLTGHLPNDFAMLPPGAHASSGGCAAWPVGMGWGSCCTYDNYTFAGASAVVGPDGLRYMHLFVR